MLKQIRVNELRAEIESIRSLIDQARAESDERGEMQFASRMRSLEGELERLRGTPEANAEVAFYFTGDNVYGSHGVNAQLASGFIDAFQDLVTKQFASVENVGQLGARGPVPLRSLSELMVSDVTRGSFGFVLREVSEQMFPSALINVVDEATKLVVNLAAPQQQEFEDAVAEVDPRVLTAARRLFVTLDDAGAAVRIVEGERDEQISRADVTRGRRRTEQIEIREQPEVVIAGTLIGLLPMHRRFEFRRREAGDVISGKVSRDAARRLETQGQEDFDSPVGKAWNAVFSIREVESRNAPPRTFYTLLGLRERLQPDPV